MSNSKRTYQVHYWYIINEKTGHTVPDRRIIEAASPQEAVDRVTDNRGCLPGFEVSTVLEIAEGWCVRQGKVVSKGVT